MTSIINPNFNIPQGLADKFEYDEDFSLPYGDENTTEFDANGDALVGGDTQGSGGSDMLYPPSSFEIVDQALHYAADGSLLIDLVVEIDDIPGVVKYDVRMSRADGET